MIKLLKQIGAASFTFVSVLFTFVPEQVFGSLILFPTFSEECSIIINRILCLVIIAAFVAVVFILYRKYRKSVIIKGHNYTIKVEYTNLFKLDNCKKVIHFDECYTDTIGEQPYEIKPNSICGQFLQKHTELKIQDVIKETGAKPLRHKSKYNNNVCYQSGTLLTYGTDFLLMAFAKLDETGLARMTRDEYLDSLSFLWSEIDKYYAQHDVAISVFGAGITRIDGISLTQQQLLDLIIASYRLSTAKIKNPHKLHIVCKQTDDFSLNKIGCTL